MASSLSVHPTCRFDEFELDPARRSLSRDGGAVPLSAKAFDVLSYLARNPGRVVTKDELLKAVWPGSFVEESNLPVYISILRKAFGDRAHYIATVPGAGYQFTANVRVETPPQVSEPAPVPQPQFIREQIIRETARIVIRETSSSSRPAVSAATEPLLRRVVVWPAALGLATVAAAGFGVWRYTRPTTPPPLVVLSDFENATGDPKLDRVLDGALEIDLQQSPFLSFLSRAKIQETLTEMRRPKAAALDPEVAREVCERNNAQVALHGVVAKFGERYLITLRAIDCQSGDNLAEAKREAGVADEIPHAIDVVAADMRKRLGESRASIKQYSVPLFDESTNSLEALQRYSEASQVGLQGKYGDAIALFKRAIELDPKFAVAYADMAACYGNLGELALQKENLAKAYQLRESVAEQDRLYIEARYSESVTGDLNAGIATYRLWTSIYPRNAVPWGQLANVYTQLGEAELAIPPGRQALSLNPANAAAYVTLARALMHAGQLDEAKAVCDQAVEKGVAGGDLHSLLMEVAVARQDAAAIEQQLKWAESSPNPSRLKLNQALVAFSHGQVRLGRQTIAATAEYYQQQGLPALGARYLLARKATRKRRRRCWTPLPCLPA
jgi:DNA-binding winged helix-turn-helix (wHTH) protein/tetratricopeptide (TPR) repeat protein